MTKSKSIHNSQDSTTQLDTSDSIESTYVKLSPIEHI